MVITQLPQGAAIDDVATGRTGRGLRVALAVGVAVLLAAVLVFVLTRSDGADSTAPAEPPASSPPSATTSQPAFRWDVVAGLRLPVSAAHGPQLVEGGEASGYTRDEQGAALAAAQVLLRTSATSGSAVFLPAIATQVTGPNTAALKATLLEQYEQLRTTNSVADGAPIPGADAQLAGYRIASFDGTAGAATVDVVLDSADLRTRGQLLSFAVSLQWSYDDWRVLAPPNGDWGAVATQLTSPPPGLQLYDQIG